MQERQATNDGVSRPLGELFTVFATQNPVEYEGTYPLPEAQLDRFLLKIKVGYPSQEAELAMLDNYSRGFDAERADALLAGRDFATPDDVKAHAPAVLRHRVLVAPELEVEGRNSDDVIAALLTRVPAPQ